MSKEMKNRMVPRLRFAGFLEDWKVEPFDKLYSFFVTNSFSRDDLNYLKGTVKNIHYGDIHTKFSTLFDIKKETVPFVNSSISIDKIKSESYCVEGDMVFADASEDMNDVGKSIEIVNLNGEKLLSGLHTLLARQIEPKLIIGFGGYLFKSDGIRIQIQKEAQGAKVLGISAGRLNNIRVYYPENKSEQQKIAACLTSLDDLISAEGERLKALQAHKKGLMQQLFPAEGETVPRVRFGEFEGEWENPSLETHLEVFRGASPRPQGDPKYYGGNIPRLMIEDVTRDGKYVYPKIDSLTEEGASKSRFLKAGSVVLSCSGTRVAIPGILAVDACIHDGFLGFRNFKKVEPLFLYYSFVLLHEKMQDNATKGGVFNNLTTDIARNLKLSFPPREEQRKIVACLSTLDDLIAAQGQKLEGLRRWKKGLMQGMFPSFSMGDARR